MAKKIKYNKVVRIDSMRDMMEKAVAAMGDKTLFIHKKAGFRVGILPFYARDYCIISQNSSSLKILIPRSLAFFSFEPAFSPTTT